MAEDGNIKSSMCLLKGPAGPIANRPEKFGKLEEKLICEDGAKNGCAAPGRSKLTEQQSACACVWVKA